MKRNFAAGYLVIISVLTIFLAGCEETPQASGAAGAMPTSMVEAARPLEKEVTEWDEFTGRLAAVELVEIRPRVGGYLESVHFKEGTMVKKGDLLYIIDPRPYEAALVRQKAELTQAEAKLHQVSADLERGKELVQKKTISAELYDRRVEEFAKARAEVDIAKAAVQLAQLDVEYTRIRAPISGRIGRTLVTPGNLLSGGEATSTLLTTLVSMDPIHFYFTGTEQERLRYLRLDEQGRRPNSARFANEVKLKLSDEEAFLHQGVMDFIDNQIDSATGTITGRAIFDNPDHLLVPGMFARIKLKGEGPYQALLLPDQAVIADQSHQYVFVLDEQDMVRRKNVLSGVKAYGLRVIRQGLSPQDRVIINGLSRIRPGMKVKPRMIDLMAQAGENEPRAGQGEGADGR